MLGSRKSKKKREDQMRRLLSVYILTLFPLYSSADAVSIDELSKTVVFLRQQSQETYKQGDKTVPLWYFDPNTNAFKPVLRTFFGTGLIVKYNTRDYVVTARHVAEGLSPTAEIIINRSTNKSGSITFEWLSKQENIKGTRWFHHPKADISVHPMAYPEQFELLAIGEDLFPKKDTETPLLTLAYVLGFPMGLGVQDKLSPIAKGTQIASRATSIDRPGISPDLQFILLDQALVQGYSGSPVFYTEDVMSNVQIGTQRMKGGERLHFVGIVSGTISDNTGGKITLVIPISYVWDIFESREFRTYERALESRE
jgi:hypothetical protein